MHNSNKIFQRFTLVVITLTLVALTVFGSVVAKIDPFYIYHGKVDGVNEVIYGQTYQNYGMARFFPYDSLLTGSSMSENFKAEWFDEKYDTKTIKLPFAGGYLTDFERLFKKTFATHETVDYVFFGLDLNNLINPYHDEYINFDAYQVSNNPIDHFDYLLSKEAFEYVTNTFLVSRTHKYAQPNYYDMYFAKDVNEYSKEITFANYERLKDYSDEMELTDDLMENVKKNIDSITPFFEQEKETQFYVMLTPYNILYWDNVNHLGEVQYRLEALKMMADAFTRYPNVHLYLFGLDEEWITDLEHYKDYIHCDDVISHSMLECLDTDRDYVTHDTYEEKIDAFEKFLSGYDFDALFEQ